MAEFRHNDSVCLTERNDRRKPITAQRLCMCTYVCVMWSDKARKRTIETFTEMKWGHLWAPVPESERENSPTGLLFDLDDFMARYNVINLPHHSALSALWNLHLPSYSSSFILLVFSLAFYLCDFHFILGESQPSHCWRSVCFWAWVCVRVCVLMNYYF